MMKYVWWAIGAVAIGAFVQIVQVGFGKQVDDAKAEQAPSTTATPPVAKPPADPSLKSFKLE